MHISMFLVCSLESSIRMGVICLLSQQRNMKRKFASSLFTLVQFIYCDYLVVSLLSQQET